MKKALVSVILFFALVALSTAAVAGKGGYSGKKSFGIGGFGYYELSDYESLYVDFPTSNFKTAGAGFQSYFEAGVADQLSLLGAIGYSRLTYANQFATQVKENFVIADILANYYFRGAEDTVQPFVAGGAGVIISGAGAAPMLDVGGGVHFLATENISLKLQLLYKTAIIHHRGEASFGVAFHF